MKLLNITAELHVFEGEVRREHPLRFGIAIEGRRFLRVAEPRGDHIGFDARPLEEADFADGSRVVVEDVTDRLDPSLRGGEIEAVKRIEDGEGRIIGLALVRPEAPPFCIWVDDDDFCWGVQAALRRPHVLLPPPTETGSSGA